MKSNYLFFRTDRIGDFLVSAILMKSIKRDDQDAYLTVVASKKNYFYIKTLNFIDEVHLYPENFIKKIIFFFNLNKKKYKAIFALDGKKRSIYFTIFLKSKFKFLMTTKQLYKKIFSFFFKKIYLFFESQNKLEEIKNILDKMNMSFKNQDLNFLSDVAISSKNLVPVSNYFVLHFDEKWIHEDYIKKYTSIEPSFDNFDLFIKKLIAKTNNNLIITTGVKNNEIINNLKNRSKKIHENLYEAKFNEKRMYLYINIDFFELKSIIKECLFIITCHGASTHLASAFNKKIFDVYDYSQKNFYKKWNSHIQNYTYFYRENFIDLSNKILHKI